MVNVASVEAGVHLTELLELVAQGDECVITAGGKPVARLVPVGPEPKRDAQAAVDALEQWRRDRPTPGLSPDEFQELLDEGRAGRSRADGRA